VLWFSVWIFLTLWWTTIFVNSFLIVLRWTWIFHPDSRYDFALRPAVCFIKRVFFRILNLNEFIDSFKSFDQQSLLFFFKVWICDDSYGNSYSQFFYLNVSLAPIILLVIFCQTEKFNIAATLTKHHCSKIFYILSMMFFARLDNFIELCGFSRQYTMHERHECDAYYNIWVFDCL
jgi:hypothetical protein